MRRRLLAVAAIAFWTAASAVGQEVPHPTPAESHAGQPGEHETEHADDPWTIWKIANFAILAGALGYLFVKKGKPFFDERTIQIRKGIETASAEKRAAEARFAEMERRLANLDAEIAAIRASAKEEMNAESERIRQETAQRLAKIHEQAEQEIVSITKMEREALKSHSAGLAIDLASRRLRKRITPEIQNELVAGFTAALPDGGGRN